LKIKISNNILLIKQSMNKQVVFTQLWTRAVPPHNMLLGL